MSKKRSTKKVQQNGKQQPAKAPQRTVKQAGGLRASLNTGGIKSRAKG
ncbi:MAG TPA: hypothetical protein VK427_14795 [Kofleriaceae bacterium]|nr:hypothetical protein [Kofleriaceae bacterium]